MWAPPGILPWWTPTLAISVASQRPESCVDSQAIAEGFPEMGPYKFVNNFLEGAGENTIFGGGPATGSRRTSKFGATILFKPALWREGANGFVGGAFGSPFIVKNNFEHKTGSVMGNVLETLAGLLPTGFRFCSPARTRAANVQSAKCYRCDFPLQPDRHCASAFQIATALSGGTSVPAAGQSGISIHDVIIDDIGGQSYAGLERLLRSPLGNPTFGI